MNPRVMRSLTSMVALPLLVACRTGSDQLPSAPTSQVSLLADDDGPRFSDWSAPVNLGPVVNSFDSDFDPYISKDGLSLYFAAGRNRQPNFGLRDIWVSHRESVDEPWGPPQNLGATINTAAHESKPTLSVDGHRLYFASNRPGGLGGFDLYVSRRRDKRDDFGWESPVNLGSPINSAVSEESALTFYEDEATGSLVIYFASNRPGLGGLDIYRSALLPDGTFGPATLVEELSSPFADQDPSIRRDGLEIYLASNRPGTYGALDLWVSTRATTADPWSAPLNLGPVINTPPRDPSLEQANDFRPSLSFDGTTLYFNSAFREGNVSFMFDIWMATRSRIRGPN